MFELRHEYMQANPDDSGGAPPAGEKPVEGTAPPAGEKPVEGAAPAGDGEHTWPADWRERLAGDDEAEQARLKRFGAPPDVYKSYRQLEHKLSVAPRDYWTPPKEEEQLQQWRKDRGIPDDPKGYTENLGDLVIGEEDKELVDSFLQRAHEANTPPGMVRSMLDWHNNLKEEAQAKQAEHDRETAKAAEDELRKEWGDDYRGNQTAVLNLLEFGGDDVKDVLLNAYASDGTPVMNKPEVLKYLHQLAGELNPAGQLVPPSGLNQLQPVEDRISEIEGVMRTDRARYNRDEKMQNELRQLYNAQEKLKARA